MRRISLAILDDQGTIHSMYQLFKIAQSQAVKRLRLSKDQFEVLPLPFYDPMSKTYIVLVEPKPGVIESRGRDFASLMDSGQDRSVKVTNESA